MNLLAVGATWLHLLATVALVGYFVVLAWLVLPTLRRVQTLGDTAITIGALERRAMPMLGAALVAFLVTGVYLMGADSRYGGPGNIGGSWATLLLVKHVLIVGMLGLGAWLDALMVGLARCEPESTETAIVRITRMTQAIAIAAVVVLLLTAAAQAS